MAKKKDVQAGVSLFEEQEKAIQGAIVELVGLEKQTKALTAAVKKCKSSLLIGEAATAKSSLAKQIALKAGRKVYRINLNGYVTPDMLVGRMMAKANNGTETFFQPGILVRAMKEGAAIILDEINAALPDTLFCLHAVLEDQPRLFIPETEEEVIPTSGFVVIGTMNPSHDYAGTRGLNAALYSRFSVVLRFPMLKGENLTKALSNHHPTIKADQLLNVARIIELAQDARKQDKITTRITLREGISALAYLDELNEKDALEATIYSKLEEHEREHVKAPNLSKAGDSVLDLLNRAGQFESLTKTIKRLEEEITTMKELQQTVETFMTKKQKEKLEAEQKEKAEAPF